MVVAAWGSTGGSSLGGTAATTGSKSGKASRKALSALGWQGCLHTKQGSCTHSMDARDPEMHERWTPCKHGHRQLESCLPTGVKQTGQLASSVILTTRAKIATDRHDKRLQHPTVGQAEPDHCKSQPLAHVWSGKARPLHIFGQAKPDRPKPSHMFGQAKPDRCRPVAHASKSRPLQTCGQAKPYCFVQSGRARPSHTPIRVRHCPTNAHRSLCFSVQPSKHKLWLLLWARSLLGPPRRCTRGRRI